MVEFHERDRLVQHFERASPSCRQLLVENFPELMPEIVDKLDAEAADQVRTLKSSGKHRVHASLPSFRIPGPLIAQAALIRSTRRLKRKPA